MIFLNGLFTMVSIVSPELIRIYLSRSTVDYRSSYNKTPNYRPIHHQELSPWTLRPTERRGLDRNEENRF